MVRQPWDWSSSYTVVITLWFFWVGQMWPDLHPLFWPKLDVFQLIQVFFSSLTLLTSHHGYNEWIYKIKIGIHYVYSSTNPGFWVMDDDNFSSTPLLLHQDLVFLYQLELLTAACSFQHLNVRMLNGYTRLRLEFITWCLSLSNGWW